MKKYKLLTQEGWVDVIKGEIYSENEKIKGTLVSDRVECFPEDWKLVKEEFVLPEKWCVKVGDPNKFDIFNDWRKTTKFGDYKGSHGYLAHDGYFLNGIGKGYTEITFEQFKKYVLKMEEKEIIGWKPKENYLREATAAMIIHYGKKWVDDHVDNVSEMGYMFAHCCSVETTLAYKLKQTGVLDLWFEPVYKEEQFKVGDWVTCVKMEKSNTDDLNYASLVLSVGKSYEVELVQLKHIKCKGVGYLHLASNFRKATPEKIKAAQHPQITINGYKGEFFDDYVKFGCDQISKHDFIDANNLLISTRNSCNIKAVPSNIMVEFITFGKGTFSKEQIKKIAEYYLNKKI